MGELVAKLQIAQPAVSKHLAVLRKVGIVSVSKRGQLRLYRLNSAGLKPVYEWAKSFEKLWAHQLDRIKERAEQRMRERLDSTDQPKPKKG